MLNVLVNSYLMRQGLTLTAITLAEEVPTQVPGRSCMPWVVALTTFLSAGSDEFCSCGVGPREGLGRFGGVVAQQNSAGTWLAIGEGLLDRSVPCVLMLAVLCSSVLPLRCRQRSKQQMTGPVRWQLHWLPARRNWPTSRFGAAYNAGSCVRNGLTALLCMCAVAPAGPERLTSRCGRLIRPCVTRFSWEH